MTRQVQARVDHAAARDFVADCVTVGAIPATDAHAMLRACVATVLRDRGDVENTARLPVDELEVEWYASLRGEVFDPAYSLYADPRYLQEAWRCWVGYSRPYLRDVIRPGPIRTLIESADTVIDLGCGIGYTTATLAQVFDATVTGTNLPGPQWDLASLMAERHGAHLIEEASGHADVVFASEYFEHFREPVDHLLDVLDVTTPDLLIVANAFGADSTGHFDEYVVDGSIVPARFTSRPWNQALRDRGYREHEHHFWNNRPAAWVRA